MNSRYICRFDDICPTMNWDMWSEIERVLDFYGVRPILAVVPDNHDALLAVSAARADFWCQVRRWQAKGWTIGLHGYRHVYETLSAGIVGINARSEFAGLSEQQQKEKIDKALSVFAREGVRADVWVAPGHSFDAQTVRVLAAGGIEVISDGYFPRPVRYLSMNWVPQQLWRFRDLRSGVWTVCHHHNDWSGGDLARFESDVGRYRSRIVSLHEVLADRPVRDVSILDHAFAWSWRAALKLRRSLAAPGRGSNDAS